MKRIFAFLFTFACLAIGSLVPVLASDNTVKIDKSKIETGIVFVQYDKPLTKTIKVQIAKADIKYTYTLKDNSLTGFPLQMGAGDYQIAVLENVTDTKYKLLVSDSFTVDQLDEKQIYLNSIQLIRFDTSMKAITEMKKLAINAKNDQESLDVYYNFIISNFVYDLEKFKTLPSDYIPSIDAVYADKKGICYDFSSLFASILRDSGIPTRLQMGYFTEVKEYHSWNQVLLNGQWVNIDTTYDAQAKSYNIHFAQQKDASKFTVVKQY